MKKIKPVLYKIWASLWMENTAYLNFLNYLLPFGIGFDADIVPAFHRFIEKGVKPNNDAWKNSINTTVRILSQMKKNGHINYNEGQDLLNLVVTGKPFLATISISGFEFIDKYQSNKSVKLTNRAVVVGIISTVIFSCTSIVITLTNLRISKDTLLFEKNNTRDLSKLDSRLDTLTQEQMKLSSTLKSIQTSQTSPKQKH